MFGCEKYNIKPDLVTIAKALSSGYEPIAAVLIGQHIVDAVGTYSNGFGEFNKQVCLVFFPPSCVRTIKHVGAQISC
jgi:4-aminobutyrate--pyruvate transaminase